MTQSRRARTRLDPNVRRRLIAEAAARVFARHDPDEVSFEAVAAEAGVSRSLVYAYFGDRGGLFAAAYRHELESLDREIGDAMESMATDKARLERLIRTTLHFAAAHPDAWSLITSAGSSRHPAVRKALDERVERIATGVGDGVEIRRVVRGVLALLEAVAGPSVVDGADDADALTDVLVEVLWSGLSSLGRE